MSYSCCSKDCKRSLALDSHQSGSHTSTIYVPLIMVNHEIIKSACGVLIVEKYGYATRHDVLLIILGSTPLPIQIALMCIPDVAFTACPWSSGTFCLCDKCAPFTLWCCVCCTPADPFTHCQFMNHKLIAYADKRE